MRGKGWSDILQFLKESGRIIHVAVAEAIMGTGGHVLLDGDGFKEWHGVVGEASAYSKRQPRITPLSTPKKVLDAIRECVNGTPSLPSESDLVGYILKQLATIKATDWAPKITTRPVHETIVEAIRRCNPSPSSGEILHLFQLIKDTTIPKGHDEIIAAINEYFRFPGGEKWAREIREVRESILEQKRTTVLVRGGR